MLNVAGGRWRESESQQLLSWPRQTFVGTGTHVVRLDLQSRRGVAGRPADMPKTHRAAFPPTNLGDLLIR
jgi:hypothetical protein